MLTFKQIIVSKWLKQMYMYMDVYSKCNFFSVDPDMSQNKTEILYNNVLYALVQFSVVLKVET